MDNFLQLQPSDGGLENIILKLYNYKQLNEVDKIHQLTENPSVFKKIIQLMPQPFARVWSASPEAKDATQQFSGVAEKRDVARAHYQAVTTFISDMVDNLYSQSQWLMEPPKDKSKNVL